MNLTYSEQEISEKARKLFEEERNINHLEGWFLSREIAYNAEQKALALPLEERAAYSLNEIAKYLPLTISENAIFVGTQRDAFARSYALINPSFKVENFSGYCDPTAVYNDIDPINDITQSRIEDMRNKTKSSAYVSELSKVYSNIEDETSEVIYFVEQVTGHLIPDFSVALKYGTSNIKEQINVKLQDLELTAEQKSNLIAMQESINAVETFSRRYKQLALAQLSNATNEQKEHLKTIISTLTRIPYSPCENLYEAIQCFILLWQTMCIEQAPNPFAFSVGNADRIFEPYRAMNNCSRELTKALLEHLLVFFNVADRSWAISQNLIIGGKDTNGNDLTNLTSYALLDAYYEMNLPQPILSVKLHKNTPQKLYEELGKFWFTPGLLTPSLFNDDVLFQVLEDNGIDKQDIPSYSIAGCQEPLIMGKDNGNTTNTWLNLAKVLELTLTSGTSLISGKKLIDFEQHSIDETLKNIKELFYKNLDDAINKMVAAGNEASRALSNLRVPFLSSFMGGLSSGYDLRDTQNQGTKYNGSGCLIHGLSIVADSFVVIEKLISEHPEELKNLIPALQKNWEGYDNLLSIVKSYEKYGNGEDYVDNIAVEIADKVSDMIKSKKNYLNNPFRPDFSSPTTHLLYGYVTGASCDGRKSREMLGYGIDPLFGEAQNGLGFRLLSNFKLPFNKFNGGYASHLGIDPKNFTKNSYEEKGLEFKDKIIKTIFFNDKNKNLSPFYIYFNITTPETLRKVLANPKKYAPNGVYIMRIHGTFVNFLDLSPQIQQDIIKRLDPSSTNI